MSERRGRAGSFDKDWHDFAELTLLQRNTGRLADASAQLTSAVGNAVAGMQKNFRAAASDLRAATGQISQQAAAMAASADVMVRTNEAIAAWTVELRKVVSGEAGRFEAAAERMEAAVTAMSEQQRVTFDAIVRAVAVRRRVEEWLRREQLVGHFQVRSYSAANSVPLTLQRDDPTIFAGREDARRRIEIRFTQLPATGARP